MKKNKFNSSSFLISGGTGSFGYNMVKKLINLNAKRIIIFSRDEKKQFDMRNELMSKNLEFIIGDVRDYKSINNALSRDIDFVFHAAALKQVPTCEFFPSEAFKTNVLGADNVMNACNKNKIKKCIVLSTDKAVNPINVMGLTKSLMEKTMISKARLSLNNNTIFCGTRYGNVMGTRGSVIPVFINQIKKKGKVTITNPDMTRFLMSVEDSVSLVIKAFSSAKSGEIIVHDAPGTSILNLAKALFKIFNRKIKYEIVGTRAGEKLHETLISKEEMVKVNKTGKYFHIPIDSKKMNYENYFEKGIIIKKKNLKEFNSENTLQLSVDETIKILKKSNYVLNQLNA